MIPLKPGYAISIHSSQGATLNFVIVNMGNREFATGLTYVAPTRVRKIENLYFDPMPTYSRLKSMAKTKIFAERRKQDERKKPLMQSMWLKPMKRIKTKRILRNKQNKHENVFAQ